jgi:hypothetical protein
MTPRRSENGFELPGEDGRLDSRKDAAMACPEWEMILAEAARSSVRSGSAQPASVESVAALEHAAACAPCRERLAAERSVSADLHLLVAADSTARPSAGCEAVLLAALRGERGGEVCARRWIFAVAGTLAASLLILIGAALLLSRDSGTLARAVLSRLPRLGARQNASGPGSGASLRTAETASFPGANEGEEEVTDFYAFYPGADFSSVDSGALVRVRVPSSELGAFGLQVAQGREDEWVNADLLVAEDGSPQAIRFVLPAPQESRN